MSDLLDDADAWKYGKPDPEPMDPDFPYDPHEETAVVRVGRVNSRRWALRLYGQVTAEIQRAHP